MAPLLLDDFAAGAGRNGDSRAWGLDNNGQKMTKVGSFSEGKSRAISGKSRFVKKFSLFQGNLGFVK